MSAEQLPEEIIIEVFKYLQQSDLLVASQVNSRWRAAALHILADSAVVTITEDVNLATQVFLPSVVPYKHWRIKDVDLQLRGAFADLWESSANDIESLMLLNVDLIERDLIKLLSLCINLKELGISGLKHILMTGNLLNNSDDVKLLSESLKNVNVLHLGCSRYLTDALFSRITSTLGPLNSLSLNGCQISYQRPIHKRFYPTDGSVIASEHVSTFKHILKFIEQNATTLNTLDFGSTSIDNESLFELAKLPELHLKSLYLTSCNQLSKNGIELLCQEQKTLVDLDFSLISRLTDYAILSVCEHLPNIKTLRIKKCKGITECGIKSLGQLKQLHTLDISHLERVSSESIYEAIAKESRPTLKWLSVAFLPINSETVIAIAKAAPNLTYLDLSMCTVGVTDRSIQVICKCLVKLKTLNVEGCNAVSDIGLAGYTLEQHKALDYIPPLVDPYKVPSGLKAEQWVKNEAEVQLYLQENVQQITSCSQFGLSNLKNLQSLNLCGLTRVTDVTLLHTINFLQLKSLTLSYCQQVTESGLVIMAHNCPSLETLLLAECSDISDQAVLAFSHHLRRIKTLDLQNCNKLTDDALDSLSYCHNLLYLDVSGCIKMSLEQMMKVQDRLPRLNNLRHRGIRAKSAAGRLLEQKEEMFNQLSMPTPPPLLAKLKKKLCH